MMITYDDKRQKQTVDHGEMLQRKPTEGQTGGFPDHLPNSVYQRRENNTGLSDRLKTGVESLSGLDMSDVRVHRNSPKPQSVNALAYTQGSNIHLAPGQEKHIAHEAWHVVQQKQGRVQPTMQMAGAKINDNAGLEKEADVMGTKSTNLSNFYTIPNQEKSAMAGTVLQMEDGKGTAKQKRADEYMKAGKKLLGADIGELRPYIDRNEKNLTFIAGIVGGEFSFSSLTTILHTINACQLGKKNTKLKASIAHEVQKVIYNRKVHSEILTDFDVYRSGKISELKGLYGELSTCAQLLKSGKLVTGIGQVNNFEDGGAKFSQEVDITVVHEGTTYFIEVAASTSMLSSKLGDGASGHGGQMIGYQTLERVRDNSKFAYACPDITFEQISPELIGKLKSAGAYMVVKGTIYSPEELRLEIERREKEKREKESQPQKRLSREHRRDKKKEELGKLRRARLQDRGKRPTSSLLMREEMYYYEEEYEDEYEDE